MNFTNSNNGTWHNSQLPPQMNGNTPRKSGFASKGTIIWCCIGFVAVLLFLGGCTSYNGMVKSEEAVNTAWGNVQASYQRRFDLIPNLVNTVKGYAEHEKSTFENVTKLRTQGDSLLTVSKGLSTFSPNSSGPSPEQLEQLARGMQLYINAVHEAYPDLQASDNFKDLQKQLESTEDRINYERNQYNDAVKEYNISIRSFPNDIFAGMFGFAPKNQYGASAEAQNAPTTNFQ